MASKIIILIVFIIVTMLSRGNAHAELYNNNGTESYTNARRCNTNFKTKANAGLNPIAAIPRLKAIKDLEAFLAQRYVFDISVNICINDYEKLCRILPLMKLIIES